METRKKKKQKKVSSQHEITYFIKSSWWTSYLRVQIQRICKSARIKIQPKHVPKQSKGGVGGNPQAFFWSFHHSYVISMLV